MIYLKLELPIDDNITMTDIRNLITIVESKAKQELSLNSLPYKRSELAPVMSEEAIDYHYGQLAKSYVDRYNKGEGDSDFNEAGAYLHNLFFPQLMPPKSGNRPTGAVAKLIDSKYGSFIDFKKAFAQEAMKIQGSGWVYMSRSGEVKTIKNHQIKRDIALLVDWWEHSWVLDYKADKKAYLQGLWKIINWDIVNQRL